MKADSNSALRNVNILFNSMSCVRADHIVGWVGDLGEHLQGVGKNDNVIPV